MVYDVAIAGGGAAGLAAAITAAKRNLRVIVIEAAERVGKKLLATGNGRCNLASTLPIKNRYNTDEVEATFAKVPLSCILAFFADLGLAVREEDGRLYPYSNQASSVLNALRGGLAEYNADVLCSAPITKIKEGGKEGRFILQTSEGGIYASNIIFAAGSPAGGGRDSLRLLEAFGHKAKPPVPALVPLLTDITCLRGLKGVRTEVKASLIADGKEVKSAKEEILFKDNGVSGTVIFELSSALARLRDYQRFNIRLDFAPEYTEGQLDAFVKGKMGAEGLFHKEIAQNIKRYAADKRISFGRAAKNLVIDVKGPSSFSLAQVASGGLEIKDFDLSTMESRLRKGLFAAGEALDVDGDCGGFNLMWAWASGILAGNSVYDV
ncbi:MAG TPA: aminoacetone oxidase family FAD-binding enzyme [Clostridia bacterium]|jgi:predicted Rossmann fold flavoprotein|nr:aminoacetone oxidase family FAD-binding enzyme [Clostridia bacterium]HOK81698.1 aminoacetone oxidase family FAD-binding enzyme [Clostridia bacterium]HOL60595.1 aminoacetone oxidase family FAD-binding enzyme [Clostridia bacterium]HPO53002.1 aminoacetone oxidase family FAD-binding enzyme [Clostridia bacterium]